MKIAQYISTIACFIMVMVAVMYQKYGGLRIGRDADGTYWYSNELYSSGSDDSLLIQVALLIFLLPLVGFIVTIITHSISRIPAILSLCSLCWYVFWLILVNFDVSILQSIRLQDYLLLSTLITSSLLLSTSVFLIYKLTAYRVGSLSSTEHG
jgi:hypothetical protein